METLWFDRDGMLFEVEEGSSECKELIKAGVMRVEPPKGSKDKGKGKADKSDESKSSGATGSNGNGESTEVDLTKLKQPQLKAILDERKVEYPKGVVKNADLIALIEANPVNETDPPVPAGGEVLA
jgi:hypothetical protein